ncbi:MAG: M24 family metallopeptidase, partial [Chloroflexi bacterium]|nr:M24 family metallopeptidase [Chloroflexota bacterium]
RYTEQAKNQAPDYEIFRVAGNMSDWFPRLVDGMGLKRLGFESAHVTFSFYQDLTKLVAEKGLGFELVPVDGVVESLRLVKSAEELALIAKAAEIGDAAMKYIEYVLRAGMTELEAAWEIERFMREKGSQAVPFEVIVAAGPNSALPHHKPSERKIQVGEPIVIDIGAKCSYYASDLTRTICVGAPEDKLKTVYDIVLKAQSEALVRIEEGMTGENADSLAREVIEKAGYGESFGHGLGHGTGLAVHELPRLGPRSTDVLSNGMVFSIEPGIYLVGWGGVRIEDLVAMQAGRVCPISNAKKSLG